MKTIPLTQGQFAIVDDADFETLSQFKWFFKRGYAVRNQYDGNYKQRMVFMHVEIINTPKDFQTDHINGNGLDNRRENLRICSAAENSRNQKLHKNNKNLLKGVSRVHKMKKFRARIMVSGKEKHLGCFSTPEEAHAAYCEAAKKHFGDYARFA